MMTHFASKYSLSDAHWFRSAIRPYNFVNDEEEAQYDEESTYFTDEKSGLSCTVCKVTVGDERNALIKHYESGWHRHNLRRFLQKQPLFTEDEYEQMITADDDEISSSEMESDKEVMPFTGGAYAYFVCEETVYSIYKCILWKNEVVSADVFQRPVNCAIFLLSGGHFCGGIFENEKLLVHKCFHRYVVRAKQGTMQSISDARRCPASSSGASLRRYNQKALQEEIQSLLTSWSELLKKSPLIFLRYPTSQRHFFFEKNKGFKLEKTDERLRRIPFETRRPTVNELQRTWSRLRIVRSHGSLENFREELQRLAKLRKKQKQLFRRKISEAVMRLSSESSESNDEMGSVVLEKPKAITGLTTDDSAQKELNFERHESASSGGIISDHDSRALYSAVRMNSILSLRQVLDANKGRREDLLKYVREAKFPPAASTFLHIAARRGTVEILEELLSLGCSPEMKDGDDKVPFQVAQNGAVRQAFSKFRSEHSNAFNWNLCKIPDITVLNDEQLAKEAEKKRIQREKKKQREKAKKASQLREKIEQEQRQKYLALPDSEKRALVAERRIAASLQRLCQIVEDDGNRCFKCGVVLVAKPFTYCNNQFCSIPCLQQHRQENPPQLI